MACRNLPRSHSIRIRRFTSSPRAQGYQWSALRGHVRYVAYGITVLFLSRGGLLMRNSACAPLRQPWYPRWAVKAGLASWLECLLLCKLAGATRWGGDGVLRPIRATVACREDPHTLKRGISDVGFPDILSWGQFFSSGFIHLRPRIRAYKEQRAVLEKTHV